MKKVLFLLSIVGAIQGSLLLAYDNLNEFLPDYSRLKRACAENPRAWAWDTKGDVENACDALDKLLGDNSKVRIALQDVVYNEKLYSSTDLMTAEKDIDNLLNAMNDENNIKNQMLCIAVALGIGNDFKEGQQFNDIQQRQMEQEVRIYFRARNALIENDAKKLYEIVKRRS